MADTAYARPCFCGHRAHWKDLSTIEERRSAGFCLIDHVKMEKCQNSVARTGSSNNVMFCSLVVVGSVEAVSVCTQRFAIKPGGRERYLTQREEESIAYRVMRLRRATMILSLLAAPGVLQPSSYNVLLTHFPSCKTISLTNLANSSGLVTEGKCALSISLTSTSPSNPTLSLSPFRIPIISS